MTKWSLRLIVLVALVYAGVLLWFRAREDAIVFHPERGPLIPAAAGLQLDSRDVTLRTSDGVTLVARVIPPPSPPVAGASKAGAGWILYLHGAGGNVGRLPYNQAWARFKQLGFGVLAIDYRGYGQSGGVPSEVGLYRDADAAYAALTGEPFHVPPARIVIYGYSLGSAVAIDLAARVPAAGLIVEGALLSVPALGAELYPFLPVAWLARNRFASVDKIARVSMPKLFIHARDDHDIPIGHGRRLFELAQAPKTFQAVAGSHTTAFQVDPDFFATVSRFVAGLGLPVAGGPTAR